MKDEKKKLLVLAALAVAIVAVGAFQFSGGPDAPPPAAKETKAEETKADGTEPDEGKTEDRKPQGDLIVANGPVNPLFANPLPARDPFQVGVLPGQVDPNAAARLATPPPAPKPAVSARNVRAPRGDFGGPPSGFDPFPLSGTLPGADPGTQPGPIQVQPEPFGYELSGIVLGDTPAAVFTDASGSQRLVTAGSSLDGDAKVVGISRGKVTVRWKKKNMTLKLGGTADAK